MKIFVVGRSIPEKDTGFIGEFEYTQAKELKKRGVEVSYLFTDTRSIKNIHRVALQKSDSEVPTFGAYLPIGGIPNSLYSSIKFWLFKKIWSQAVKEKGKPDIVHFHFPLITCNELIFKYLKEQNIKIVVTEHWTKVQTNSLKPQWRTFLKELVKDSDAVLAVSDDLKKSIQEITHTQREIDVIPNMVNSSFETKIKVSQNHKNFKFFGLGRLVPHKNFDLLIKSFAESFKENPGITLEIAGEGPEREKLKELIQALELEHQVSLLGRIENSQVGEIMNEAQAVVVPSSLETFGVPIIEGWFMGKPVIASDNNPLLNYFSLDNGILFKKNSQSSLSHSLQALYTNYKNYEAETISRKAHEIFSAEAICRKLKAVYSNIL